jgi:UDP-glucose 4-epimerase
MGSNILVTGGAGFIGSHLVDALLADGFRVRVIDNLSTGKLKNLRNNLDVIDFIQADLNDPGITDDICKGIDCVFHLAGPPSVSLSVTNPLRTQKNGEVATLLLLQAATRHKVRRLVFSSSCSVYGDWPQLPICESAAIAPLSPYAASKAACEAYIHAFATTSGLDTISLRYFNVFGPRQTPTSPYSGVLSNFGDSIRRGVPLVVYGDGRQTRDFIFVSDIIGASMRAMRTREHFQGLAVNVGTGFAFAINDVIEVLIRLVDRKLDVKHEPRRVGDIYASQADVTLADKMLAFRPQVGLAEGLQQLLSWVFSHPDAQ